MTIRKLASIQKIEAIESIPEATSVELATVGGWQVIVKIGQFRQNDEIVYFEIDSHLDSDRFRKDPAFDFLVQYKYRIRSRKFLGKYISQGLVWDKSILPDGSWSEGDDVTDVLGVVKYEPPPPRSGGGPNMVSRSAGDFPSHLVPKTDEQRLQSAKKILDELASTPTYVALKMDGSSVTVLKNDGETMVCSRNLKVKEFTSKISDGDKVDTRNRMWAATDSWRDQIPEGFAVQGEICGPGIQKNRICLAADQFYAFQVYNIADRRYLDYVDFIAFCEKYGIQTVPILDANFSLAGHTVQSLLEYSKGQYPGGHPREGIVIRPLTETYSHYLRGRASFKVINNDFLFAIGE